MQIGIIGKPASGKTTIFNSLSGAGSSLYNKKNENIAVIKVPDPRLDFLEGIYSPPKKTQAEICFVDIGASFGNKDESGFGKQVTAKMREMDAFVIVVKDFQGGDPGADAKTVVEELIFLDLVVADEKVERNKKENLKSIEMDVIIKAKTALEQGKLLRNIGFTEDEQKAVSGYRFLTLKPMMTILNRAENNVGSPIPSGLTEYVTGNGIRAMEIAGQIEMEVQELDLSEQAAFLESMGIKQSARDKFINEAYDLLEYVTFLTAGPKEVRAWTIRKGTTAVKAAGKIHSDIERGFIRAEVMKYAEFVKTPDEQKMKEAGKCRMEGKNYIVEDGDMVYFRFNVG